MKEKKLTDDEIIKAFENCYIKHLHNCDGCPCDDWGCGVSKEDILDLINSQKATIAEYERKLEDGELVSKEWHDEQVMHLQEEIKRLMEENKYYRGELQ